MAQSKSAKALIIEKSDISRLHGSVFTEILARLPLRTLLNCRLVCKTWYSIMSDSCFHHVYSTQACRPSAVIIPTNTTNTFDFRFLGFAKNFTSSSLSLLRNDISAMISYNIDQDHSGDASFKEYQVGNLCHGLVCLVQWGKNPRIIWNPILGEYVILPDHGNCLLREDDDDDDDKEEIFGGFGYCPISKRYKVVRFFRTSAENRNILWGAEILEFVDPCNWRSVRLNPQAVELLCATKNPSLVYMKGVLHWLSDIDLAGNLYGPSSVFIICFDLERERFRRLSLPAEFDGDARRYYQGNLSVFAGCLSICVVDLTLFRPDFQFWCTEDSSNKFTGSINNPTCWVKKLSIKDPCVEWWNPRRRIQIVSWFHKGKKIVLTCGRDSVFVYDTEDRDYHGGAVTYNFHLTVYVPSFVSLKDVVMYRGREVLGIIKTFSI